jgi:hypothetical protein
MKRLGIAIGVLAAAGIALIWSSDKKKHKRPKISHEHEGELDESMSGPRGEDIYIGAGGSRYYIKDDKRVYVGYKMKKAYH